jgi:hypothetical protein
MQNILSVKVKVPCKRVLSVVLDNAFIQRYDSTVEWLRWVTSLI